jgi:hypothetical protein
MGGKAQPQNQGGSSGLQATELRLPKSLSSSAAEGPALALQEAPQARTWVPQVHYRSAAKEGHLGKQTLIPAPTIRSAIPPPTPASGKTNHPPESLRLHDARWRLHAKLKSPGVTSAFIDNASGGGFAGPLCVQIHRDRRRHSQSDRSDLRAQLLC